MFKGLYMSLVFVQKIKIIDDLMENKNYIKYSVQVIRSSNHVNSFWCFFVSRFQKIVSLLGNSGFPNFSINMEYRLLKLLYIFEVVIAYGYGLTLEPYSLYPGLHNIYFF